jgi:hypothetical protein
VGFYWKPCFVPTAKQSRQEREGVSRGRQLLPNGMPVRQQQPFVSAWALPYQGGGVPWTTEHQRGEDAEACLC